MTDFSLTDHGSIVVLTPLNNEAREWLDRSIDDEAQWFGRGLVIEPRYVGDIVDGIIADGLTVG